MSPRKHRAAVAFAVGTASLLVFLNSAFGQDAQVQATAKAAHQQTADDAARSNPPQVVTPTKLAAPPRDKTTIPNSTELKRRAGEQIGDNPQGRSLVLGMKVQEVDNGSVKVVGVGTATPAYEAGIQKGDRLVSFDNFSADNYRKWIDGMRRLATKAPPGAKLPVVLLRNGERVITRVRVPENHTDALQLPMPAPPSQPQLPGQSPSEAVGIPMNGDNFVTIENSGPFANFFNDQSSPATERAMAELFRVGDNKSTNPLYPRGASGERERAIGSESTTNAPLGTHGARIGLAGFRNDPNGVFAMVDVGALDPGNYIVGISDASVIGNQPAAGQVPSPKVQTTATGSTGNATPAATNNNATRSVPRTRAGTGGALPAQPTEPVQPQSSIRPAKQQIPRIILAQTATVGEKNRSGAASAESLAAPTDQASTTDATPTGQSGVNSPLNDELNQSGSAKPRSTNTGVPMVNQIGTLTVDQSGTGRMQKVVEGLQVRNIVGQALVIYAPATVPTATLPPNLDATADPVTTNSPETVTTKNVASTSTSNSLTPIAAGIIRLLPDRQPSPAGAAGGSTAQEAAHAPNVQPASKTPLVPPDQTR